MKKVSGVYKLVYLPTKQFYIGSTRSLYNRWHTHKSHFKAGRHHKSLQALYNITGSIDDWKITLIKATTIKSLNRVEQLYLNKYMSNVKCLNQVNVTRGGRRNKKTNTVGRERLAVAMLGKNAKDGTIHRPNNLVFISPSGKEYHNIISVKRFAEEHNLPQPQMNNLANGNIDSFYGWIMKGADLPFAANVVEYWSRERMLQNFPEYEIVGPDNKNYKTFALYHFETEHSCKVMTKKRISKMGVRRTLKGLDKYGRGYRLNTVPYLVVTYNGKVYDNVISIGKWGEGVGLSQRKVEYVSRSLDKPRVRNKYKISLDLQIQMVTPVQ